MSTLVGIATPPSSAEKFPRKGNQERKKRVAEEGIGEEETEEEVWLLCPLVWERPLMVDDEAGVVPGKGGMHQCR
jgi:hypothetical protein